MHRVGWWVELASVRVISSFWLGIQAVWAPTEPQLLHSSSFSSWPVRDNDDQFTFSLAMKLPVAVSPPKIHGIFHVRIWRDSHTYEFWASYHLLPSHTELMSSACRVASPPNCTPESFGSSPLEHQASVSAMLSITRLGGSSNPSILPPTSDSTFQSAPETSPFRTFSFPRSVGELPGASVCAPRTTLLKSACISSQCFQA